MGNNFSFFINSLKYFSLSDIFSGQYSTGLHWLLNIIYVQDYLIKYRIIIIISLLFLGLKKKNRLDWALHCPYKTCTLLGGLIFIILNLIKYPRATFLSVILCLP